MSSLNHEFGVCLAIRIEMLLQQPDQMHILKKNHIHDPWPQIRRLNGFRPWRKRDSLSFGLWPQASGTECTAESWRVCVVCIKINYFAPRQRLVCVCVCIERHLCERHTHTHVCKGAPPTHSCNQPAFLAAAQECSVPLSSPIHLAHTLTCTFFVYPVCVCARTHR